MWIARVVDNNQVHPTEFVGPMTAAQADKFCAKHDSERYTVYLEMLCKPSTFVGYPSMETLGQWEITS